MPVIASGAIEAQPFLPRRSTAEQRSAVTCETPTVTSSRWARPPEFFRDNSPRSDPKTFPADVASFRQSQARLATRHARVATLAATSLGGRAVAELLVHLT